MARERAAARCPDFVRRDAAAPFRQGYGRLACPRAQTGKRSAESLYIGIPVPLIEIGIGGLTRLMRTGACSGDDKPGLSGDAGVEAVCTNPNQGNRTGEMTIF
ncbi:hypothetical protein EDC23_2466 [Thiohalophilus thiocyanatoxydans]|uniref:Uncharacterized protein n=2 Tax=Thiohalophilus thiocyanatoxydans TaxID=381308 RepID=A0A4R8IKW7_9GAMM|nr:hypothetical protein EDC23_2466 [Thiohalophilus thiocyanatoxydans]